MKVTVKKKIAKTYTQEQMDSMSAELGSCRAQIMELKQKNAQLEAELLTEKKNHALMTCGMELWQKDALEAQQEVRNLQGQVEYWQQRQKDAENDGKRAAAKLAEMMMDAITERDAAIAHAAELNVELMDREQRIWVLEQKLGIGEPVVS